LIQRGRQELAVSRSAEDLRQQIYCSASSHQ
jgi:hypothetical protein